MHAPKTLVFIPTYNEAGNVERMCEQLLALHLPFDILFMDDGSPDGTGEVVTRLAAAHPEVFAVHRPGKLGIGSAHLAGLRYAYAHGYERLVSLDGDFTHSPADIPRTLAALPGHDVVVGSRYLRPDSLPGWNPLRRGLTLLGHLLTSKLLRMPFDASGAFRAYNLATLPPHLFEVVHGSSYSFFFFSLFVLAHNGYSIKEIPIVLPARTYGHSKMTALDALRSAASLIALALRRLMSPGSLKVAGAHAAGPSEARVESGTTPDDSQGWDAYWSRRGEVSGAVYARIAESYRQIIIKPNLHRFLKKHFPAGADLLHAGCGSGQVDVELHEHARITAVDISSQALRIYAHHNPRAHQVQQASVFDLPNADQSLDGVYNLGVVEHFTEREIHTMLREFNRVLRPGGKVVLFWPHCRATSVFILNAAHFILNRVLRRPGRLHPPEISLLRSKRQAIHTLRAAGFSLVDYSFGPRDLFVQSVVVGQKPGR